MAVSSPDQLMWRLVDETGQGADLVTFVLPGEFGDNNSELCLETDIIAALDPVQLKQQNTDLKWSEDDVELLLVLLEKMLPDPDVDESISLDFNDPSTIEIIHIIASARFSQALDLTQEELGSPLLTELEDAEVGNLVAVNFKTGFKLAVIVELDSIDATCVLLEDIDDSSLPKSLSVHDVVVLSRHDLLPATFGNVHPGETDSVH